MSERIGNERMETYWDHVSEAASLAASRRGNEQLISVEASSDHVGIIDFKSFAKDYPEKLFALLNQLRPDHMEIFIEYYLLEKSQNFLAKAYKMPQSGPSPSGVNPILKLVRETIGAFIKLGTDPSEEVIREILEQAGLEKTDFGSLAHMIKMYAATKSYAEVAEAHLAPIPAIRKIFRPAIETLTESRNLMEVSVGAYLRGLTHGQSLTSGGFSPRYKKRLNRVQNLKFTAPAANASPLTEFGHVEKLADKSWCMFEVSEETHMSKFLPQVQTIAKKIFQKKAAQIFAPLNERGDLHFGYFMARCESFKTVKSLVNIRGISEIGAFKISNKEVQKMIRTDEHQKSPRVRVGDFVRILTGEVARYCGTVVARNTVEVCFPSGRTFTVTIDPSSVEVLDIPEAHRAFWGKKV